MSFRRTFIALGASVLVSGCALMPESPEARASASAAIADGVSTHLALAGGAIETNPLIVPTPAGLAAVTALKLGLARRADQIEDPSERRLALDSLTSIWGGASANNLMVLVGAAPAMAIFVGLGTGYALWRGNEAQRSALAALPVSAGDATASEAISQDDASPEE